MHTHPLCANSDAKWSQRPTAESTSMATAPLDLILIRLCVGSPLWSPSPIGATRGRPRSHADCLGGQVLFLPVLCWIRERRFMWCLKSWATRASWSPKDVYDHLIEGMLRCLDLGMIASEDLCSAGGPSSGRLSEAS
jgi:hypothetical protein